MKLSASGKDKALQVAAAQVRMFGQGHHGIDSVPLAPTRHFPAAKTQDAAQVGVVLIGDHFIERMAPTLVAASLLSRRSKPENHSWCERSPFSADAHCRTNYLNRFRVISHVNQRFGVLWA